MKNSSPQPTVGGQSADCWPFVGRQILAHLSIISMLAQWTATCAGDMYLLQIKLCIKENLDEQSSK